MNTINVCSMLILLTLSMIPNSLRTWQMWVHKVFTSMRLPGINLCPQSYYSCRAHLHDFNYIKNHCKGYTIMFKMCSNCYVCTVIWWGPGISCKTDLTIMFLNSIRYVALWKCDTLHITLPRYVVWCMQRQVKHCGTQSQAMVYSTLVIQSLLNFESLDR